MQKTQKKHFYYCDCNEKISQIYTKINNPKCSLCGQIMTFGKYKLTYKERYENLRDFLLELKSNIIYELIDYSKESLDNLEEEITTILQENMKNYLKGI